MPVIPSFNSYAPVPRLAESYLGARRIEQAERENLRATELGWARVGQEAASDLARTQVAREQIAANQVENEMRLKAQQDMLERKLLQDQQEANIKNAYDQIKLGLDERRVKSDEAIAAMRLQEAADEFSARQEYFRRLEAGEAPDMAFRMTLPKGVSAAQMGRPASPFPALNFQLRQLEDQEQSIMNRYPGLAAMRMKPDDAKKLQDIQKRRAELQIPDTGMPPTATGTNVPAMSPGLTVPSGITNTPTKRLRYNPQTGEFE